MFFTGFNDLYHNIAMVIRLIQSFCIYLIPQCKNFWKMNSTTFFFMYLLELPFHLCVMPSSVEFHAYFLIILFIFFFYLNAIYFNDYFEKSIWKLDFKLYYLLYFLLFFSFNSSFINFCFYSLWGMPELICFSAQPFKSCYYILCSWFTNRHFHDNFTLLVILYNAWNIND